MALLPACSAAPLIPSVPISCWHSEQAQALAWKGQAHDLRRADRLRAGGLKRTGSSTLRASCELVEFGRSVQAKLSARIGLVRDRRARRRQTPPHMRRALTAAEPKERAALCRKGFEHHSTCHEIARPPVRFWLRRRRSRTSRAAPHAHCNFSSRAERGFSNFLAGEAGAACKLARICMVCVRAQCVPE